MHKIENSDPAQPNSGIGNKRVRAARSEVSSNKDPDYRRKKLEASFGQKFPISCSKCHHCR